MDNMLLEFTPQICIIQRALVSVCPCSLYQRRWKYEAHPHVVAAGSTDKNVR